jgi:hypothetical protein
MDDKRFWDIISVACPPPEDPNFEIAWHDNLVNLLKMLPPQDIVRFDRFFDEKTDALYTQDHWGAAYLINGGASDDGFYYWRCWLVGMGKQVYEAALANPDTLADVVTPLYDYEAEIYGVARNAWEQLGLAYEDFDKASEALGDRVHPGLTGDDWNFDDNEEIQRRFPRLAAMYLDDDFVDDLDEAEGDDWE